MIPFAHSAEHATGVDISPSMLDEARRNCADMGVGNVSLVHADELANLTPAFDLVHSAIVLQHVPAREGQRIIGRLASLLRPGGAGFLHLQIGGDRRLKLFNAAMKLPLGHNLVNVVRGRRWSYPQMQMNVYDLSRVMLVLRRAGVTRADVTVAERDGVYDACTLIFRR